QRPPCRRPSRRPESPSRGRRSWFRLRRWWLQVRSCRALSTGDSVPEPYARALLSFEAMGKRARVLIAAGVACAAAGCQVLGGIEDFELTGNEAPDGAADAATSPDARGGADGSSSDSPVSGDSPNDTTATD